MRAKAKAAPKRRRKVFLRDEAKGQIFQFFAARPGKQYDDWDEVASEVQHELGFEVTANNLRHLRTAFDIPFTVLGDRGQRNGATAERQLTQILQSLGRIEQRLTAIETEMAKWR